MVKNNYLLPLILDLIDSIGKKKVFMKMDLHWGYNNVRIKEEDKWKAAFSMPEELIKPMVMFFRLTNSPATFHAMMNDLLRDLVVKEKITIFIDDVIVKFTNGGLSFSLFLFPFSFHFCFIFLFFYF